MPTRFQNESALFAASVRANSFAQGQCNCQWLENYRQTDCTREFCWVRNLRLCQFSSHQVFQPFQIITW
jgi:hypothetical protein